MAQIYNPNTYQTNHKINTDMTNIENNFACIKSCFSGSSAPSNILNGMKWYDTTNKRLKYYNTKWYTLFHGDTSQQMLIYRNSAMDGWVIVHDSSADKLVALKGGSTYTSGGSTQGTWQQSNHTLTISELPSHRHAEKTRESENAIRIFGGTGSYTGWDIISFYYDPDGYIYTDYNTDVAGVHNHGATWRPAAAVFTLQHVDL